MGPLWLVTCFCLWLRPRGRPSPKSGGGAWSATVLFTYFLSQWSHPRLKLHPVEVAQVVEPFRKAFVPAPGGHLLSNRSKTVTLNEGRSLHSTWLWGVWKIHHQKCIHLQHRVKRLFSWRIAFQYSLQASWSLGLVEVLQLLVTKSETTKLRTNSGLAVFEASCKSSRPPSKLHIYTSQLESTSGKAVMANGKIKNIFSSSSTRSWRLAVFLVELLTFSKSSTPIPSFSMQLGARLFLLNAPLEGNEFLFCTHLTSCWKTARTQRLTRLEPLHHCCTETSWLACEPDCARAVPLAELLACHSSLSESFHTCFNLWFSTLKMTTQLNAILSSLSGQEEDAWPFQSVKHQQNIYRFPRVMCLANP